MPESRIWTPQRAARRRSRHGPPLCSTTFGGATVPPLFAGSGGGGATSIFLRSTSAWYDKTLDGQPFTVSAPARDVGDSLFFLKAGFGQNIVAPAGWVALPAYTNNYLQIFWRTATDTAADDFAITETTTRPIVGQMACFGNTLGETTQLFIYQGGGLNNRATGADTDYDVFAMASGPIHAENIIIEWGMSERNGATTAPTIDPSGSPVANSIGEYTAHQTFSPVGTIWAYWRWEFESGVSNAKAFHEITYTPLTTFRVETTQMQRLDY